MLNRVFKTIFILTLCLGITLPANAGSVDVSDGSAFITKAEMAYKLNNLSKRMTELENSLDSTIDKLISSYLTRNGIWNGTKQIIVSDGSAGYSGIYGNESATGRLLSWKASEYGYLTSASYKMVQKTTSSTTSGTVVESCGKSGLLFFNYRYQMSASSNSWGDTSGDGMLLCVGTTNASSTVNGDWPAVIIGSLFSLKKGTDTLWSVSNSMVCPIPSTLKSFYVPNSTGSFFVSKGDKVTWNISSISYTYYSGLYLGGFRDMVYRYQILSAWIY